MQAHHMIIVYVCVQMEDGGFNSRTYAHTYKRIFAAFFIIEFVFSLIFFNFPVIHSTHTLSTIAVKAILFKLHCQGNGSLAVLEVRLLCSQLLDYRNLGNFRIKKYLCVKCPC